MFAFLSRFRRETAVLAVLALVASVLVAVPASAADDDPKMDYPATFSACIGEAAEGTDFTDVPEGHANAGHIDCIAYYGITKGTSATTYAPLMSVTREQMALFLTRLAGLVGIPVSSDPADPGFTDTGDLSDESQMAIAQLAALGVTKGTSDTTYSPADVVTRGHMALFIARLMDEMKPMADGDTMYGYTPEKVVDVPDGDDADDVADKTVKSPFTDLGQTTKETYDAITALWELNVASGVSETSYSPSQSITRASMAGFMAGVLHHSNARPMGVTIQASKTWDYDDFDSTIAVSYRDAMFMPMADVSVKVFYSGNEVDAGGVGAFNEDGGCSPASGCAWTDNESLTDDAGNIFEDGAVSDGQTNTYYAWMGDPDADENNFDVNESPHASVTLSSTTDAVKLKVTTDINENSTGGNTVDIDATSSVTLTAQLVDGNGEPVAKSGVTVNVSVQQGESGPFLYPAPAAMKTDDHGRVTYSASGPKSTKGAVDVDRTDTITFTSDVDGSGTVANDTTTEEGDSAETVDATIVWTDSDPTLIAAAATDTVGDGSGTVISGAAVGSGKGSVAPYALRSGEGKVTIKASVAFYDQYGNGIGKGLKARITIGTGGTPVLRTLSGRGTASWTATIDADLGTSQTVAYALEAATSTVDTPVVLTPPAVTGGTPVHVVTHADDDSSRAQAAIGAVYADENRFRIEGALYTYDSDDIFLDTVTTNGVTTNEPVDMAKFETLIGGNIENIGTAAQIVVVAYDDDGRSIFRVVTEATA